MKRDAFAHELTAAAIIWRPIKEQGINPGSQRSIRGSAKEFEASPTVHVDASGSSAELDELHFQACITLTALHLVTSVTVLRPAFWACVNNRDSGAPHSMAAQQHMALVVAGAGAVALLANQRHSLKQVRYWLIDILGRIGGDGGAKAKAQAAHAEAAARDAAQAVAEAEARAAAQAEADARVAARAAAEARAAAIAAAYARVSG